MKLRQLFGHDVVKALGRFGFEVESIRGSHAKLRRVLITRERRTRTIPLHKAIRPGMLHAIFRQACRYISESDLKPWFFSD